MELVEFAKVLIMDIDLLVMSNIDELFELQAPAAMRRGMNDSWWPLQLGDPVSGKCFFMGKDASKWSWNQGTGINAGVMLWQPDLDVQAEMLAEISEANHPEHCTGNGPEQDYLSRFWADAPWRHISCGYNYQIHQMFLGLHPDKVENAERINLLRTPEKIKVVHFSGEDSAKPWRRVLDKELSELWPDRSRDADYERKFAEEFQGFFLWILRDPDWMAAAKVQSSHGWELEPFFVGEDGSMYRKAQEEGCPPTCVDVPDDIHKGAMTFISNALKSWFDAFQELEVEMGLNLRQALHDAVAVKVAETVVAAAESQSEPRSVTPWQSWAQHPSGWWCDSVKPSPSAGTAATVLCGFSASCRFVSFNEGGVETWTQRGIAVTGVFVKLAGVEHAVRHFVADGGTWPLDAMSEWARAAPDGQGVLLAILGVEADELKAVLTALAALGTPHSPPPDDGPRKRLAMAAVGLAGGKGRHAWATHAALDVAYASTPFRSSLAAT